MGGGSIFINDYYIKMYWLRIKDGLALDMNMHIIDFKPIIDCIVIIIWDLKVLVNWKVNCSWFWPTSVKLVTSISFVVVIFQNAYIYHHATQFTISDMRLHSVCRFLPLEKPPQWPVGYNYSANYPCAFSTLLWPPLNWFVILLRPMASISTI